MIFPLKTTSQSLSSGIATTVMAICLVFSSTRSSYHVLGREEVKSHFVINQMYNFLYQVDRRLVRYNIPRYEGITFVSPLFIS